MCAALRLTLDASKINVDEVREGYLFTADYAVKPIQLCCRNSDDYNGKFYYFTEKAATKIEDTMPLFSRLCLDKLHKDYKNMYDYFASGEFFDLTGNKLKIEDMPCYKVCNGETVRKQKLLVQCGL